MTLKNKVYEALGQASMCWSETPKGVFDSSLAAKIGDELWSDIEKELKIDENTSDGYHTFKELYDIRLAYNVALFNEWGKQDVVMFSPMRITKAYEVHKSWKHHDGELCFGGGWFIVVAVLPSGQISNHYEEKYWDLFRIPETEKALYPFDGHGTKDVIERLKQL